MIQAGLLAALLMTTGFAVPPHARPAVLTIADQAGNGESQPGAPTPAPRQKTPQSGVIHPPQDVDPHMAVTPPHQGGGSMPVIPPPGSPGGKPNVEPR